MPVIQNIKPDSSNKGFLRALFAAIVFMFLSGTILVSGFLAWHYPQLAASAEIEPITLTGKDFYIAIGKGDDESGKLILKELDEAKSAVISSKKALFNASRYPVVEYKITGRTPGATVVLYWRTVTHNHKTLFAKLHWNGNYLSAYNMSNEEEWKGAVTELGISVSGDLRKQPITIEQVTFSPWTVKSLLLLVWTEWNAFEGWSQKSINAIRGMPKNALLSPVVAAAAWCGLAMFLYSLWLLLYRTPKVRFELEVEAARQTFSNHPHPDPFGHPGPPGHPGARVHGWAKIAQCRSNCRGRDPENPETTPRHSRQGGYPQPIPNLFSITRQIWDFKAIVIMFMIAWFALDGKWQVNLWRQLADTKYLFAGKSHHEQHLAAEDANIYTYARQLSHTIPTDISGRLIILNSAWRDYPKLRLMYYLLPLNVYAYGDWVNVAIYRPDDLLLILTPMKWLFGGKSDGMLSKTLSAKLLHSSPRGNLYVLRRIEDG